MTQIETRGVKRRSVVAGAAWSVPVIVAAAPAAHAGPSQCNVNAGVNVGPFVTQTMRAICGDNSQTPTGGTTIWCNYGLVYGPAYVEICNCTTDSAWYSWRETDAVSDFQIEVDGIQDDENGPKKGWRPPFKLQPVGQQGGCQKFALTYRTSATRPYNSATSNPTSGNWTSNTLTITLYRNPSTSNTAPAYPGPNGGAGNGWSVVTTLTVSGLKIWRTAGNAWSDPVNFWNCNPQGGCGGSKSAQAEKSSASPAEQTAAAPQADPSGD